jgi:hypothetical protein
VIDEGSAIPYSLRPAFQEYRFEDLSPKKDAELIIERVLSVGDRSELRWLLGCYGREVVVDWVRQMGARRLPWRRYNLWCVVFDLPCQRFRDEDQRIWPH